jgi:hypothetical protein
VRRRAYSAALRALFSPAGRYLAGGDSWGRISVADGFSGEEVVHLGSGGGYSFASLALSPGGKIVALAREQNVGQEVVLWNVRRLSYPRNLPERPPIIR